MATVQEESRDGLHALAELSGTVLEERYELGRVLGAGAMGAVFQARHLRLDRPVAIKVMRPVFAGHEMYIQRFLREAKAASKIRHRNVVEILDYGEAAGGLVYSVMELLVGKDLEQLLVAQPGGCLPWSRACPLLVQIASGLKAAHARGVIHRDIKPANCFVTNEDDELVVKLVDFGIAKVEDSDHGHQLTATAQVLGTPSYIAPELVRTITPASPRSDIYALGVLAYRMLSGRVPFTGDTVFELWRRACFDPVPSLRERVSDLSTAVEGFVLELLAKSPEDRPQDMLSVRERLLVLGRETLGPQVLTIPASSALVLDAEPLDSSDGAGDTGSSANRAVHDELRIDEPAVERTEVVAIAPTESPPQQSPPTEVPVPSGETSGGAPRRMIDDPTSLPIRSGETVIVSDHGPLHRERGAPTPESPRRSTPWIAIGGVALALMGAIVLLSSDDDESEPLPQPTAAAVLEAPMAEADAELGATTNPRAEVRATRPSDAVVAPADEPPGSATEHLDEPTSTTSDQAVDRGSTDSASPDEEPVPVASPTPALDGAAPASPRRPQGGLPRTPGKTKVPPSDASRIAEIKRLVGSRCATAIKGSSVTVSFVVNVDGDVMELTTTPKNAAGSCAAAQVEDMKFRPRTSDAPKSITVK